MHTHAHTNMLDLQHYYITSDVLNILTYCDTPISFKFT